MLALAIGFTIPAILAALLALPLIWYLLRVTPPRPALVPFPPLKLILDEAPREETPSRTPWWLLALRLLLAALLIVAMAGPVLNPLQGGVPGKGPLLLLMDAGWPAAPDWNQRISAATQRLASAERNGQAAALVSFDGAAPQLTPASATLAQLRALVPSPYVPNRMDTLPQLQAFVKANPNTQIVWIADGLDVGNASAFAKALAALAPATVIVAPLTALGVNNPENAADGMEVTVLRADALSPPTGTVIAQDAKGLALGSAPFVFDGHQNTQAHFTLPLELRNEVARIEIAGQHSAGAVSLIDARWRRRRIGIVNGESADLSQPLLSPTYYLRRALSPFAEVRESHALDPIRDLISQKVAMLVLADIGQTSGATHQALSRFVDGGGVLVRFAGIHLANAGDDLLPVPLRDGDRVLGSVMSWETPKKLAAFDAKSPLFGLNTPQDVTVTRQVLAEPDIGLRAKTWATLADGTPLVTAAPRGRGIVILVHVSADPSWSSLPLSGLFVDMLHRFSNFAHQNQTAETGSANDALELAPAQMLDGFGVLGPPQNNARPIATNYKGVATRDHPPGFYGPPEALLAINTVANGATLIPADYHADNLTVEPLKIAVPVDLRPALLVGVLVLFLLDALASLWLAGHLHLSFGRHALVKGMVLLCLCGLHLPQARADVVSPRDMQSILHTRLAYALSGDAQVDRVSALGLQALSRALDERTSLSPGAAIGIDPARDELAFYPMIYWPIVAGTPQPSPVAVTRIAAYMKHGGTIVFDTRDALVNHGEATPEQLWLRALLAGVDVPQLERVPAEHVVTKTFYLINGFVGRYANGETWIQALPPETGKAEDHPARAGDGVSPIIITSNDLASAWAVDRNEKPLFPMVPGGEDQREMALRGGINLAMYTLTGNYKADQVHVHDLLRRLSH